MQVFTFPKHEDWGRILQRPGANDDTVTENVKNIIDQVKKQGDETLIELTERFDKWKPDSLIVTDEEFDQAASKVSEELKSAILLAQKNIEKFHAAQRDEVEIIETSEGVRCWRKSIGIERVGLYVPGGTAPLVSTLLMLGVPAKLAGCREIIVCSPAKNGEIHPALLYTASLLGIRKFFKVGGAQAIAAMAYGTQTISAVYKIFGPGNSFVMRAKQLVNQDGVAIDMPAGPSEVAVYADETCKPAFVAADLLSQCEHGRDSQALLVTTSEEVIRQVLDQVEEQKQLLPRHEEITASLNNSIAVVLKDIADCFSLLNTYAPEHLIIASDKAAELSEQVVNAGSVFLGNYSPESAGDYVSGTNHTLPTSGFAKAYSGVSLDSFVKKVTFQQLTKDGLKNVSVALAALADAEGLEAHKNAVLKRFEE